MNEEATIEVYNPYDESLVATVRRGSREDAAAAITRAQEAFGGDELLAIDRFHILRSVCEKLTARKEDFARMVTAETGKPITESRVEADRAATTLEWSAQQALRIDGIVQGCDVTPQRLRRRAIVARVPLGVVAVITPFNFPLNITAHKVGPALAAGNAVVVKPSPKAPLATAMMAELFHQAGLPEPMLQVLHGYADVVEELATGPVQAVTFTGSTSVGRSIAAWAAGKKILLELGGNDPVIVMDDADKDAAAAAVVAHRFSYSGQRCTACKRAFFHAEIYEEMKERVLARVAELVVGDPGDEATDVGPLIDADAAATVMAKVDSARATGASILCGGTRDGAMVAPTVVEGLSRDHVLCKEETFGPVLPIFSFTDLDGLIESVNATAYGLQAGLFTDSMSVIQRCFDKLQVGALMINDGPALRVEPIPFGGVKDSGLGREGVCYAVEEFTQLKTMVL